MESFSEYLGEGLNQPQPTPAQDPNDAVRELARRIEELTMGLHNTQSVVEGMVAQRAQPQGTTPSTSEAMDTDPGSSSQIRTQGEPFPGPNRGADAYHGNRRDQARPPKYQGLRDGDAAKIWLRYMEDWFRRKASLERVANLPDEEKVAIAVENLEKTALTWWVARAPDLGEQPDEAQTLLRTN